MADATVVNFEGVGALTATTVTLNMRVILSGSDVPNTHDIVKLTYPVGSSGVQIQAAIRAAIEAYAATFGAQIPAASILSPEFKKI